MLLQILLRPRPRRYLGNMAAVFYDAVADLTSIHLDYCRQNLRELSNCTAIWRT